MMLQQYCAPQSQIQDFPKEGAPFAEFFCGLRKPTRFSGGGVVAEFSFPWPPKAGAIQWGGVVPGIVS